MAGAAGHAEASAIGKTAAGGHDCMLERLVHDRWGADTNSLNLNRAAAIRADLHSHAPQEILKPVDYVRVVISDLEQHFRTSRDDTRRTRIERDAAGGPYGAWPAGFEKSIINGDAKSGERQA